MSDEHLKKFYSEILIKNMISDKIAQVSSAVPKNLIGEHFGSICESVTITFENKPDSLHLFVKKILPVSEPAQLETMHAVMLKEGYFLTTLRQDLLSLCVEKLGQTSTLERELDALFPKTYYADKTIIVMEDLVQRGFRMVKRQIKHDVKIASVVTNNLAKLHGVSYALVQQLGGKNNFLKNNPHLTDLILKSNTEEARKTKPSRKSPIVEAFFEILQKSDVPGSSELHAKLEKYRETWYPSIGDVLRSESLMPVVNHGDAWSNNMMVSDRRSDGTLDQIVFYDLQGCRVASPAADLVYYMYTSVDSSARKLWKSLLESYFLEFRNTVAQLGHELRVTFPEFLEEYGRVAKMGFLIGLTMDFGLDVMQNHDTDSESEYLLDKSRPGNLEDLVTQFVTKNPEKIQKLVTEAVSLAEDFEEVGSL